MKQSKKLTRNQRNVVAKHKLDTTEWRVVSDTPEKLVIINSKGEIKELYK